MTPETEKLSELEDAINELNTFGMAQSQRTEDIIEQAARRYAEVLRVYEELKSVGDLPVSHKVAGFDKIAAIVARGE